MIIKAKDSLLLSLAKTQVVLADLKVEFEGETSASVMRKKSRSATQPEAAREKIPLRGSSWPVAEVPNISTRPANDRLLVTERRHTHLTQDWIRFAI